MGLQFLVMDEKRHLLYSVSKKTNSAVTCLTQFYISYAQYLSRPQTFCHRFRLSFEGIKSKWFKYGQNVQEGTRARASQYWK